MRHVLHILASVLALLTLVARAQAEPVPPVAKSIKADETAILLVDFQANFVSPDGAWYGKFAEHYKKTRMLDRIVVLVRKARAKGVLVVHITEGYTSDYREPMLPIQACSTAGRSAAAPGRSARRKPPTTSR
jgi:nicotinamidase-related amidase